MSDIKSRPLIDFLGNPKEEYTPNYKVWGNKNEWKIVGGVKSRIRTMYNARQSSCYGVNYDGSKSWDSHWNLLEKDYLMYSDFDENTDDWRSNLKSCMTYRTVSALDAKERRQDIGFLVEARNEADESKGRAFVYRYMYADYFRRNKDVRYKFLEVSKRAKIFGTAIAYVPYTVKVREVMMPKALDIKSDDIKEGKFPEQEFEKKYKVDYEDADFIPWDIRDFYIDPNARGIHGTDHPAIDAAGELFLTPSQVRMMFQGDPLIKNLDKIHSTNEDGDSVKFFEPPKDIEGGYGRLILYYNVETDSEVIIYNDILLKEGPIPYIDKSIPFIDFRFIKHPGHFYGMGVGDTTMQIAAEDSTLRNLRLDRIKFTTAPPVLIGSTIFGEIDDQWNTLEPNLIIKVADVSQAKAMSFPEIPFDSFRITEELKDDAVMNTGVNPHGMSLPMSSTPATNTLAMKETASEVVNMYVDNLMEGMGHWGRLLGSRFTQFYSMPTKKSILELDKKEMRKLRLEDIDIYKNDEGDYKHREIKGSKIMPVEQIMFEWNDDPRVYVNPDFIAPLSSTMRMRKAQETLPQLIQLAGNPGDIGPNGSGPVIDVRKLVRWFLEQMEMDDKDLIIDDDEDRIEEIQQALEQQQKMQDGELVDPKPGEPLPHRYTHAIELRRLNDTVSSPDFEEMVMNPAPEVQIFIQAIDDYRQKLVEHLRVDSLLDFEGPEASVGDAMAITQAREQGMGMPSQNNVDIPTVSGNMGLPNEGGMPVPNHMGVEDITGQVAGSEF